MFEKNQDLVDVLCAHDVPAEISGGWVKPVGHGPPIRAFLVHHNSHEASEVVRLDVHCALEDGRILFESFAGTGADLDSACKDSLATFCLSTLHVLLAALYDRPCDDQVAEEVWAATRGQWRAFLGNATVKTMGARDGEASKSRPQLPEDLVPRLQKVIEKECPGDARPHWVRVFACQLHGDFTFEAMLDSGPWAPLEDELRNIKWSTEGAYYSIRLFLLVLPEGESQGSSPRPVDALSLEVAVLKMVDAVHANPDVSDEELSRVLTANGVDPVTVDQLVTFAPMGFSTFLLAQATLPTTYEILDEQGKIAGEFSLFGEPVFCVASSMASILAADPDQKDRILAFASRCSLMTAANKALYAGSRIEDLKFTPFLVFRAQPSSLPRSLPSKIPLPEIPEEKRPWWKFW